MKSSFLGFPGLQVGLIPQGGLQLLAHNVKLNWHLNKYALACADLSRLQHASVGFFKEMAGRRVSPPLSTALAQASNNSKRPLKTGDFNVFKLNFTEFLQLIKWQSFHINTNSSSSKPEKRAERASRCCLMKFAVKKTYVHQWPNGINGRKASCGQERNRTNLETPRGSSGQDLTWADRGDKA